MKLRPQPEFDYDLYYDTETFCETPIRNGTHAYAEKVEIMIAAWAVNDNEVTVEDITETGAPSAELLTHLRNPRCRVICHKSDFDRTVTRHAWGIAIAAWRILDTMVWAMAHSLPGGLDKLCDILKIDSDLAKDKEGSRLIQLFCKPLPKNQKLRRATRLTHPVEWARFLAYAGRDILSMRAIRKKLPTWNFRGQELALWQLDQKINDRGILVDVELAQAAVEAIKKAQAGLKAQTGELTGDKLTSTLKRDAMLAYLLDDYGITLPDLKKDTIERRIEDPDLPWALKELLSIRLQASTTSTSKYAALLRAVSQDGVLRGLLQFVGAIRTGRWAGRLFQPQNLPRPSLRQDMIDAGIEAILAGCIDLVVDNVMEICSNALRGLLIARPGKKFVVSDLSNIEGRVASWLSGEKWKLQAFRDYDTITGKDAKGKPIRKGHDLYVLAYARAMHITPEEVVYEKDHGLGLWRQIGKVMELALGYEGGVGAFLTFAAVYGLDLEAMADAAWDMLDPEVKAAAEGTLRWVKRKKRKTYGLPDKVYLVCEAFKAMWRSAHPETAKHWKELEAAAKNAIMHPGTVFTARRLKFYRKGAWLRMILPSGRSLCYPSPQISESGQISYMGVNQYSRKWSRIKTYGGKLFENACQAIARDVMAENMPEAEDQGYEILLTVHDELITEAPANDNFTTDGLSAILASNPSWAEGLPLAAGGFEAKRYKKD